MTNRLHQHMAFMVTTEASMGLMLDQIRDVVSDHDGMRAFVDDCIELTKTQRQAIDSRLHEVAERVELPDMAGHEYPSDHGLPLLTAIQRMHVAVDSAIVGYSVLQLLALRHRDNYLAGDGNTADLAVVHYQNYLDVMSKINTLLHDVAVWELDREGVSCRCTCPSCDLGVCLCAPSSRSGLNDAWNRASPDIDRTGVYVYPPRPDSAAAAAGLSAGDVIETQGADESESLWALHELVESCQTGAAMKFRVRHQSGENTLVSIVRPRAGGE